MRASLNAAHANIISPSMEQLGLPKHELVAILTIHNAERLVQQVAAIKLRVSGLTKLVFTHGNARLHTSSVELVGMMQAVKAGVALTERRGTGSGTVQVALGRRPSCAATGVWPAGRPQTAH
eukprot:scaffold177592_cov21-Tisochrysis_lutea.AAC.3